MSEVEHILQPGLLLEIVVICNPIIFTFGTNNSDLRWVIFIISNCQNDITVKNNIWKRRIQLHVGYLTIPGSLLSMPPCSKKGDYDRRDSGNGVVTMIPKAL